jgi:hypothetical protein
MADLNLVSQSALASTIQTRITQLKTAMDLRKDVWSRLSIEKKRAWVQSGKDPIMTLAWNIYKYLRNNFFEEED